MTEPKNVSRYAAKIEAVMEIDSDSEEDLIRILREFDLRFLYKGQVVGQPDCGAVSLTKMAEKELLH